MKKIFRNLAVTLTAVICSVVGMTGISVSADTTENSANYLSGDVNSDGKFTIADVLIFQKWITGSDVTLNNWQAVDFNQDGVLDVFDLCIMKNELRSYNSRYKDNIGYPVSNPDVIDEFTPCTATDKDFFDTGGIRVVIKHQYSVSDRVWTVDDFKGIDNIKSFCQSDNYNPTSSVVPPYRQIIKIGLEECSVENVLKMVHDIEALNLPEVMKVEVRKYGTGGLPMTPEEWEEYVNSIEEENKSENQSEEYPVKNPVVIDEFIPCPVTEDGNFDGSNIRVVIKHQYSVPERVWTIDDFKGIDNIKTFSQNDNTHYISTEKQPYRQIIEIGLEECSTENALKMVHDIEALNLPEIMEVQLLAKEKSEVITVVGVVDANGTSKDYVLDKTDIHNRFAVITNETGNFSIELTSPDGKVYTNYENGEFLSGLVSDQSDSFQVYSLDKTALYVVNADSLSDNDNDWTFRVVSHLPYRSSFAVGVLIVTPFD
ncbi:MAG: dockerin type I repeat-containing protein [Ruminococcus sp.]|nr:dockerin type I repeat-containing protein [Ruminococcus sp.]